ncbi:taste receptor type 1 member 1 [Erpetoichthys calabaricus]|uniref:taste receptor type 1 member 1 n=1 Tax=Erpetoichthys calabaricus TaxID=27687 RepID=UPI00223498DF|nr:taste receptor type 1 member 1 [Erpetoichthys calabaricus]
MDFVIPHSSASDCLLSSEYHTAAVLKKGMQHSVFCVILCLVLPSTPDAPCSPTSLFEQEGDYKLAGMFPIHNIDSKTELTLELPDCKLGKFNKHGYYLLQAMRFTMEEINSARNTLLPNVKLGYRAYDICSETATLLATMDLFSRPAFPADQLLLNTTDYEPKAVALIGPDSSTYAFTSASILGYFMFPLISYEATNEMLSNKKLYPSFFRTISSDKNQVLAILQLLATFRWTWVAVLGSDNDYGKQGLQSISELAETYNICIAYQGIIPSYSSSTRPEMIKMINNIIQTKVNTVVVFSSKRIASGFFSLVMELNITGKVWIGSEDWSISTKVSGLPKIKSIGSVLGISTWALQMPGFANFVLNSFERNRTQTDCQRDQEKLMCIQDCDICASLTAAEAPLDLADIQSAFNVYLAIYAVAYSLHDLLGCSSGNCSYSKVQPWQLLDKVRHVNFSLHNIPMFFDQYGNPPFGYNIISWNWTGDTVSYNVVGSYSPGHRHLEVNTTLINWNAQNSKTVPTSLCAPDCPSGYRRLQRGAHICCFDCEICPAMTYISDKNLYVCEPCQKWQWSPAASQTCFARTLEYLEMSDSLAVLLLVIAALTILLIATVAAVFLRHLDTPVVRSAGGRTCLVMLASLASACSSIYFHLGLPSHISCILQYSVFCISVTVCLSCIAVRAFQIVCIFKMSSNLPKAYEWWAKNNGPQMFILIASFTELFICILHVLLDHPLPIEEYSKFPDKIVLECSGSQSPVTIVELSFVALLSCICFALSYIGKDLPANYNEAKCITFSLLIYLLSWLAFFTTSSVYQGKYINAMNIAATLASVLGILGGYFTPKCYIILLKPHMNTAAHFQNCIQMYTTKKSDY